MHRRSGLIAVLAMSVIAALIPVAAAGGGHGDGAIRVTLDRDDAELADAPAAHCHDAVEGTLTCFRTPGARDDDVGVLSVAYVVMYVDAGYGGGSLTLTQPVPDLGVYAFNDVTTSFKSLNGGHPKFYADANYSIGNGAWQWSAGAWVTNVGSGANDRFSSVKDVP